MSRFFPVLTLVCALVGAVLGWNAVPHYRTPAANGEARLRERAATYYQATRLFDYLTMAQHYTPAKQLAEQEGLLEESEKHFASFKLLPESNQANLHVAAESITSGSLEVELEGGWATTWGMCIFPTENSQVQVALDKMVWVRSGGDWWIYTWTKPEIAAYGNPPDESYKLLRKRRYQVQPQQAGEMPQEVLQIEQPETPVAEDDGDSPQAENGSVPEDAK